MVFVANKLDMAKKSQKIVNNKLLFFSLGPFASHLISVSFLNMMKRKEEKIRNKKAKLMLHKETRNCELSD